MTLCDSRLFSDDVRPIQLIVDSVDRLGEISPGFRELNGGSRERRVTNMADLKASPLRGDSFNVSLNKSSPHSGIPTARTPCDESRFGYTQGEGWSPEDLPGLGRPVFTDTSVAPVERQVQEHLDRQYRTSCTHALQSPASTACCCAVVQVARYDSPSTYPRSAEGGQPYKVERCYCHSILYILYSFET